MLRPARRNASIEPPYRSHNATETVVSRIASDQYQDRSPLRRAKTGGAIRRFRRACIVSDRISTRTARLHSDLSYCLVAVPRIDFPASLRRKRPPPDVCPTNGFPSWENIFPVSYLHFNMLQGGGSQRRRPQKEGNYRRISAGFSTFHVSIVEIWVWLKENQ